MLLPHTGETTEFMKFETGKLHYGSILEDSLSDVCAGPGFTEIRLPWQLIGFMDPSSGQVMGNLIHQSGDIRPAAADGVYLGIARADSTETVNMERYSWDHWELPVYHERLKASYAILKDYFAQGEQGR